MASAGPPVPSPRSSRGAHWRRTLAAVAASAGLTAGLWGEGFPARAAQPRTVAVVRFEGAGHVPTSVLEGAIRLRPSAPFSAESLDADRKSLLTLGYFRRVAAFEQSIGSQVLVTFRLAEWPQVAHIRITGNTAVDLSSLHATVGTRLGQVLSTRQLAADIAAIEKVYRARGFVARVSERIVDEATSSGILRFEIIELRIGAVEVEAPLPGLAERCRRVLQETPPRLYQPAAVAEDQARLLNLPHVRSAEPVVESLSEGNRPGTAAMSEPGKVKIRWRVNSGESRSGREGLRAGG